MNKKSTFVAAVLSLATLSTATAWAQSGQTVPPTRPAPAGTAQTIPEKMKFDIKTLREIDDSAKNITYKGLSVDSLEDTNVVMRNGDKVGEIDRVLADGDNKVVAVTVDAGGIMGIGSEKVVVALDDLTYDAGAKRFVTNMTADQLKTLPKWDQRKK